jgi:hypothetical protein
MCSDPPRDPSAAPLVEKCKRIDDLPRLVPGWGCCQCRRYNGYQRKVCKFYGHAACFTYKPDEVVPVAVDGTLVVMTFAERDSR